MMIKIFLGALLMSSSLLHAADSKDEWHPTTLKDETIKNIQRAQHKYKKCVTDEMQKKGYAKIDSRNATDAIIKRCENELTNMRTAYLKEGVPEKVADRYLRKMRVQITRRLLKEMIVQEAARTSAGK